MNVLAIDPGTFESAWVKIVNGQPHAWGKDRNETVLRKVVMYAGPGAHVACEKVESYGMPVGAEVFETVRWCGRFEQAFLGGSPASTHECWHYIPRRSVKLELCGVTKASDANIRQAVIDLYGGKQAAIGLKASPGPLYGMKADVWQAFALGLTYARTRATRAAA